jgi:pentatricopeptide repeat protein
MRVADNRTRSPGESDTTTWQREPWHIVDEICASMQSDSRLAVAARNVELYCELQHVLKAKGSTIMEATWYARYSSFDLYNCMVQCVVRTSQHHLVECLIQDMAQHGIARPLSFYEAAMKQLAGRKQYQLAMDVYKHLAADGLTPSNITYSCLVSFAAELGEYDKALSLFGKLSAKTTPSIRAYMTVLRVHGKRQDWPASLATFREMQQRGLTLDNLVLNVVLATGIAADNVEEVDALVAEGDVAMPTPITDVVSYNTLVKGYLQRNDLTTAVGILDRMQHRGIKPNAITFNTMMERAARSHNNALAWSLLEKMRSFGLKPDRLTCSSLVRALGKHSLPQQIQDCTNLLVEATLADGRSCCDAPLLSHLQDIVLDAATACACQEPQLLADVRKAFKR